MIDAFTMFVNDFDVTQNSIKRKYDHSLRVQKRCEEIARSEKLSDKEYRWSSS